MFGETNNAGVACGDDGVTDTPITADIYLPIRYSGRNVLSGS